MLCASASFPLNLFLMQSGKWWRNFTWLDTVQYVIAWSGKVGHLPHREPWSFSAFLCRVVCFLLNDCTANECQQRLIRCFVCSTQCTDVTWMLNIYHTNLYSKLLTSILELWLFKKINAPRQAEHCVWNTKWQKVLSIHTPKSKDFFLQL